MSRPRAPKGPIKAAVRYAVAAACTKKESVDLPIRGQRGPGGFPAPITGNAGNPLWRWADVERWFADYEHRTIDHERPAVIAAINSALEGRRHIAILDDKVLIADLQELIAP